MIKILHNLALFRVKNAIFFAEFFGENILKIITSVPDAGEKKADKKRFPFPGRRKAVNDS
jgi:hypothetical protein